MKSIEYYIDCVERQGRNITIRGWAFSKTIDRRIEVKILESRNIKRQDIYRHDVKAVFNEYKQALESGFEIKYQAINIKKDIQLEISDGVNVENYLIPIKEITVHYTKYEKLIMLLKKVNINKLKKSIKYINEYGIKALINKVKTEVLSLEENTQGYMEWFRLNSPNEEMLEQQRNTRFGNEILISIVTPTYNTPKKFLVEMIESVINQTYTNWELCIADASTLVETKEVLEKYKNKFKNIKITYLRENLGISENTNKAIELVTGQYVVLFDHDDLLTPNALYELVKVINEKEPDLIYSDEDKVDEDTTIYFNPQFKPRWSIDTLRNYNYITHLVCIRKQLLDRVGYFRKEFDGSQDYDLLLRIIENTDKIEHIQKILYHWRVHKNSTATDINIKAYAIEKGRLALQEHLNRMGIEAVAVDSEIQGVFKVNYKIIDEPMVSIIIPNKDQKDYLKRCIESIIRKSTYKNYEIIVVENNSTSKEIKEYYKELNTNFNVKILTWEKEFNFSSINNYAASNANGQYLLFLNNDIEIITEDWLQELLMLAQRKDVGLVGAKLYYEDDTIQHVGVSLDLGGIPGHFYKDTSRYSMLRRLKTINNVSAVTGACMLIKKSIFEEVNGFNEEFGVAFNDIDLCARVLKKGYTNIINPYCEMYHFESKSRGYEDTEEKKARFIKEVDLFHKCWDNKIKEEYFNANCFME